MRIRAKGMRGLALYLKYFALIFLFYLRLSILNTFLRLNKREQKTFVTRRQALKYFYSVVNVR